MIMEHTVLCYCQFVWNQLFFLCVLEEIEQLGPVRYRDRDCVCSGSISNENRKDYPYYFRTIAENKMYK